MAFPNGPAPSTYTWVSCTDRNGLFLKPSVPAFYLNQVGANAYEIRFWGRDDNFNEIRGDVVSSGSVSGQTLFPTAPSFGWNCGYYRLYLTGPTHDAVFGYSYGAYSFFVLRDTAGFVSNNTLDHARTTGDGGGEGRNVLLKAVMGIGTSRVQIGDASSVDLNNPYYPGSAPGNSYTGDSLWACRNDAESMVQNQPSDPARPWPIMCQFPGGGTDGRTLAGSPSGSYMAVYPKTTALNPDNLYVQVSAGTASGTKIRVYYPDSSTLVETLDNLGNTYAATTAVNAASAYLHAFARNASAGATASVAAVGTGYRQGVIDAVSYLWQYGVTRFEGPRNEGSVNGELAHTMMLFQAAVHAGNADAKAIGPCPVDILNIGAWRDFFNNGGGDYCDEFSTHMYNSQTNGDINLGRYTFNAWFDLLAEFEYEDKLVWSTESTHVFSSVFGVHHPLRSRVPILQTLLLEQYGVPRERNQVWYDYSHGFWNYPSFLIHTDGSLVPYAGLYRCLAEETWGKLHDHAIDFGSVQANRFLMGSVYKSAADNSSTAVLVSHSFLGDAEVTLTLSESAVTVTICDGWGNEKEIAVNGTDVTVPVTDTPTYVRIAPGVQVWVSDALGFGASPPPSASQYARGYMGGVGATGIADNTYLTHYGSGVGFNNSPGSIPDEAILLWADDIEVQDVIITCASPYQLWSALVDFDVETTVDGGSNWVVRETVTKTSPADVTFDFATSSANAGCSIETWWDEQWVFPVHLSSPVSCNGIRITVRETSYGGEPTPAAVATGQGYASQRLTIQEIAVPSAVAPVPFTDPYYDLIVGETGLVGYWRLGEATGSTVAVSEVNSPTLNGTYTNTASSTMAGPIADGNSARNFSNAGNLSVSHNSLLNLGDTFSIEFWFNVAGNNFATGIDMLNKGSGSQFPKFRWDQGNFRVYSGSTMVVEATGTYTDTQWHHLVYTKSGATSKFYIDGQDVSNPGTNVTFTSNSDTLFFGWQGQDELAIYSVALTAQQVLDHFNASSTPNTTPEINTSFFAPSPVLSGLAQTGQQIQCSEGLWTAAPTLYEYQWEQSANGTTGWAPVSGATRSDYIVDSGDAGLFMRCEVTASNVVGVGGSDYSNVVEITEFSLPDPPESPFPRVTMLSGVKSTTSDPTSNVADVNKGWSNWV